MGFQEDYEKALEKGKIVEATHEIMSWNEEGETLFGKVLDVMPFTEGIFEEKANQYIIQTDTGIISCVFGSATDKQLEKHDIKGKRIMAMFKGKRQLKDNKQVNIFVVRVF